MPESPVLLAKLLDRNAASCVSVVMVRGVFQTERDARAIASAFGCDVMVLLQEAGRSVMLGEVVAVKGSVIMGEADALRD